jgi:hypothetical protein
MVLRSSTSATTYKRHRETEEGMLAITVFQVLDAASELLNKSR